MIDPSLFNKAVQRLAEQRIEEAMQRGAFDNLPGKGKPIPDLDESWDPNWWVKRLLKREHLKADGRPDDEPGRPAR